MLELNIQSAKVLCDKKKCIGDHCESSVSWQNKVYLNCAWFQTMHKLRESV